MTSTSLTAVTEDGAADVVMPLWSIPDPDEESSPPQADRTSVAVMAAPASRPRRSTTEGSTEVRIMGVCDLSGVETVARRTSPAAALGQH